MGDAYPVLIRVLAGSKGATTLAQMTEVGNSLCVIWWKDSQAQAPCLQPEPEFWLLASLLSLNPGLVVGKGSMLAAVLLLAIEGRISSVLYSHILFTEHTPRGLDSLLFSLQLRKEAKTQREDTCPQ